MSEELFFRHDDMPYAECRYSVNSGKHYKPHLHSTLSIGAIDNGTVIYRIEDLQAKLQPGSLALINPEKLHSCNPAESAERSYYMLHLDVAWCTGLQHSIWKIDSFLPVKTILLEDRSLFNSFIDTMQLLMHEGEISEKEQHLAVLAESIFRQACEPAEPLHEQPLKIELIKSMLSSEPARDLRLSDIAGEVGMDQYSLLRQFKAATGVTPHAYRLNFRIEAARKLLQKGADLTEVALECGFFDQSHFNRYFKAVTTVTPGEYQGNFTR